MRKTLLTLIIVTMIFLTACQPTPEKEQVVGKNDFEEKITSTQGTSQGIEYSNSWRQEFKSDKGDVTIMMDAHLEVPAVSGYPVVNVVPTEITKDDIEKWVEYFFNDQPVYDMPSGATKSELTEFILQYKYDLETLEQSGKVHYTTHIFTSEEIPKEKLKIQSIIDEYESLLSTAEDTTKKYISLGLDNRW